MSIVPHKEYEFNKECIGFIPNTSYGISVNCKEIVTHNTAILGVLGSGKTTLALELVLRMLDEPIKVWIIDVNGEYELALNDSSYMSRAMKPEDIMNDRGHHQSARDLIRNQIHSFIENENLSVNFFSLKEFGDIPPAKGTQWIAEEILTYYQSKNSFSRKAKFCLVLEEAHSLVPEWSSTVNKIEQNWTNGTARAVMQGRKYGFGCLLVTQRTANVTKSILNQCNTMFALQIFDDTGKEFLQNYFGEEYCKRASSFTRTKMCCIWT